MIIKKYQIIKIIAEYAEHSDLEIRNEIINIVYSNQSIKLITDDEIYIRKESFEKIITSFLKKEKLFENKYISVKYYTENEIIGYFQGMSPSPFYDDVLKYIKIAG
jgi:hypothetical protein